MNSFPLRDSQLFGTFAAVGACLGGVAAYALLRRRPAPMKRSVSDGICWSSRGASSTPP